jgi:hypothetical protein
MQYTVKEKSYVAHGHGLGEVIEAANITEAKHKASLFNTHGNVIEVSDFAGHIYYKVDGEWIDTDTLNG